MTVVAQQIVTQKSRTLFPEIGGAGYREGSTADKDSHAKNRVARPGAPTPHRPLLPKHTIAKEGAGASSCGAHCH